MRKYTPTTMLSVMLALLLTVAGCGNNAAQSPVETATPAQTASDGDNTHNAAPVDQLNNEQEVLTLRLMYEAPEAADDPLAELIRQKFALQIEPLPYPPDGGETVEILTAAGDAPDFMLIPLEPSRLRALIDRSAVRDIPQAWLDKHPSLTAITDGDARLQAFTQINGGGVWYLPRVDNADPAYSGDRTRIYYRKDWAQAANLPAPATTEDLFNMAVAFTRNSRDGESGTEAGDAVNIENSTDDGNSKDNASDENSHHGGSEGPGLAVAESTALCFTWMFGFDPDLWVYEENRCQPAFYTDAMREPLAYARRLWEAGALDFINPDNGTDLNRHGILIDRTGDAVSLEEQVLAPVAETMGVDTDEAYASYVGVADIPVSETGKAPLWRRSTPAECWVARADLPDKTLERALELFDYSLTDEARAYVRYGLPGVTYAEADGGVFLFTDPETNRAYDLRKLYPTEGFLNVITRDAARNADVNLPYTHTLSLRMAYEEQLLRYYQPPGQEAAAYDALCRVAAAPDIEAAHIEYRDAFIKAVTSTAPLDEAFEHYLEGLRQQGIETLIETVTEAMSAF